MTQSQRTCGTCTLCCKLVPVEEIHKAAGIRCEHARVGQGCTIYATRPISCRFWSCRWLVDAETAALPRPDRAHYVIDIMPDFVVASQPDTESLRIQVVQVWVDPAFPAAHHDPALRNYLLYMAEQHSMAAIIRFNSLEAIVLFAPVFSQDGEWHEVANSQVVLRTELERQVIEDYRQAHGDAGCSNT